MILILSITSPIFLIIIFSIILFFFIFERKNNEISNYGKMIYKLDIEKRKIFVYDWLANKSRNKDLFKVFKKNKFVDLNNLTHSFVGKQGEPLIRNMLLKLSRGSQVEEISFKVIQTYKIEKYQKIFQYHFFVSKIDQTTLHNLVVSWNIIETKVDKKILITKISRDKIIKNNKKYKGFVSFNLNRNIENIEDDFFNALNNLFKMKKFVYFFSRGMFIISFFSKSAKKLDKQINQFIYKIKNIGHIEGIKHLYYGTGLLKLKEINTIKKFNIVLKTLAYNVNVSIKKREDFIDFQINKLTKEDEKYYRDYVHSYQLFRQALRAKDIQTKTLPIKSYNSKRKIIDYEFPTINSINPKIMKDILRNKYNRDLLIDVYADKQIQTTSKLQPRILEIHSTWLKNNFNKITLNKTIYAISFFWYENFEDIYEIIQTLLKKGLIFAIKLKNFNENVVNLIKNITPQFIIIDNKMSNKKDVQTYFDLLSIKKLANALKIKIIHENPINYDEEQANKIGLQYYYNF